MEREQRQVDETLMRQHLESTVSADGTTSLAHVWLRDYGVHVWAIASSYLDASKEKNSENERIDFVARQYHVTGEAARAGLLYFRRHPVVIGASALLNSLRPGEEISPEALSQAQEILKDAEGRVDPLFDPVEQS